MLFKRVVSIYIIINKNESTLYLHQYWLLLLIFYICQLKTNCFISKSIVFFLSTIYDKIWKFKNLCLLICTYNYVVGTKIKRSNPWVGWSKEMFIWQLWNVLIFISLSLSLNFLPPSPTFPLAFRKTKTILYLDSVFCREWETFQCPYINPGELLPLNYAILGINQLIL